VFCPNCGAQNQDTATACAKCGFALKAATSAPKFKGTMLMMNAPPQAKPAAPGAPAAAPPVAAPPAAAAGAPAAAPQPVAPKPKLKGTMIGVAPPSLGSNAPPIAARPAPPADPSGFGAPPPGFGAPPPGFGAPPTPEAPAPMATSPMAAQQPVSSVNPLGGTVVADAGAFGAGFPPAPPQGMGGPPADLGAPPPGFGAPPPAYGGDASYGAPPNPSAMAPVPQMQPMAPADDDMAIPGVVGGPNPIVTVLLIVATCGIYGIYLLVKGKKQG